MSVRLKRQMEDIWSCGKMLHTVQRCGNFADCKEFVDMPLKVSLGEAVAAFEALPEQHNDSIVPRNAALINFLYDCFDTAGSDLKAAEPPYWDEQPEGFLPHVQDASIRQWALHVHSLWSELHKVGCVPSTDSVERRGSLLYVPMGFIVPGERFREQYYWDTYWIVRGLLVSGMSSTAMGLACNLLHLLREHGFVPNGNRTYYLNRSQPPLLSATLRCIEASTKDLNMIRSALPLLIKEHEYWTSAPKAVLVLQGGKTYKLSRYYADWDRPRPESYREDMRTAAGLSEGAKAALYRELATAAESGWDFSSRWLSDGVSLATIRTTQVIPVDLNAFLYDMEVNIVTFAKLSASFFPDDKDLDRTAIVRTFEEAAANRREAIKALMWDAPTGQWRDLIIQHTMPEGLSTVTQSPCDSAANYVPMWAGVAAEGSPEAVAAVCSFKLGGLFGPAGVQTTSTYIGCQWDGPNAWPPIQDLLIQGFRKYGGAAGKRLAATMAQRCLLTMYTTWSSEGPFHHRMLEKYDAREVGISGGGGEYNVQTGFGWTNGVMLTLLAEYGWQPGKEVLEWTAGVDDYTDFDYEP